MMKNAVFWDVRCLALIRPDFSEERIASIIRVIILEELGTTLEVTSNRSKLRRKTWVLTRTAGVTSQKTPLFIVTAVKISHPTGVPLFGLFAFV
jgi:hypothetical protein